MSPHEATIESGYSHSHLKLLTRQGRIRATTRHGIVYFSAEYIQGLKVPEGFLSLEEAVRQSNFSAGQIKYRIQTNRVRSVKRHRKRYVSAEDLGIRTEEQKTGTGVEGSIDMVVEEFDN